MSLTPAKSAGVLAHLVTTFPPPGCRERWARSGLYLRLSDVGCGREDSASSGSSWQPHPTPGSSPNPHGRPFPVYTWGHIRDASSLSFACNQMPLGQFSGEPAPDWGRVLVLCVCTHIKCVCLRVCVSVCIQVCVYAYVSSAGMHVCTCVYTHVSVYTGVCVRICVPVHLCTRASVCVCIWGGPQGWGPGRCSSYSALALPTHAL